jgi:hypothetical protein
MKREFVSIEIICNQEVSIHLPVPVFHGKFRTATRRFHLSESRRVLRH